MMTRLAWLAVAVAVIPILALLSLQFLGSHESAYAQSTVNFDIDPDPTGNTASNLGPVEDCARVDIPSPSFDGLADYVVDVVVSGDTQAPMGYDSDLNYDQTKVHIVEWSFGTTLTAACSGALVTCDVADSSGFAPGDSVQFGPPNSEVTFVISVPNGTSVQVLQLDNVHSAGDAVFGQQATDALIKMPGADAPATDALPDSDGTFHSAYGYAVGGPGTGGDGTITRVGLDIGASGLVTFSFNNPGVLTAYASVAGTHPVTAGTAELAINQDCAPAPDSDDDGFSDAVESYVGTDPLDNCPDDATDDAWPLDIDMNTFVTVVGDILNFRYNLGKDVPTYPAVRRLDLNGDGAISVVADVWRFYNGMVGSQCSGASTPHPPPPPSQGGPVTMDIDPDITGNNGDTLGTIEDCSRCDVAGGDMGDGLADCTVDVVVTGDTQAPVAYDAPVNYDDALVDVVPWGFSTTLTAACGPGGFMTCIVADSSGFVAGETIQFGPPNDEVTTVLSVLDPTSVQVLQLDNAHSNGDDVFGQPATDTLIKMTGAAYLGDLLPDSDGTFNTGALHTSAGPGTAGDGTLVRVGLDVISSPGVVDFSLNAPPGAAYASVAGTHPVTLDSGQLAINQDCPLGGDADGDGLPDSWENTYACTDSGAPDAGDDDDSDGLTHAQEYAASTDPCDNDTDNDTVLDGADADPLDPYVCQDLDVDTCDDCSILGTPDPSQDGTDTDSDGLCDAGDSDDDNDGLPDIWEDSYACTDSGVADAGDDDDSDGLTHAQEYAAGTHPCDNDTDNDTVLDGADTDPLDPYVCQDLDADTCDDCSVLGVADPSNDGTDTDSDGECNAGDPDDDGDTVPDASDNCPLTPNLDQTDTDSDGVGDACDDDADNDGLPDIGDPAPLDPDADDDNVSDGPADPDGGGPIVAGPDNCLWTPNSNQLDTDSDGAGDACDDDDDNDGFTDDEENSLGSDPLNAASTPEHISLPATCTDGIDNDLDGLPDLFDCDNDGDGIANYFDTCPLIAEDLDGYQDDDGCPDTDNDMDGVLDVDDGCPNVSEDIDAFKDSDGCPDPDNDDDGFPDYTDQCPGTDWTAGPDGIADTGDEPLNEYGVPIQTKEDYDGIIDVDGCHDSPGDDWDGDGIPDELEAAGGTDPMDADTDDDDALDGSDNCSIDYNPDQQDVDGDGIGDICDADTQDASTVSDPVTGDVADSTLDGDLAYSGATDDPGSTVTIVEDSAGEGTIQSELTGDSLVVEAFDLLSPSLLTVDITWVVYFNPGISQPQLDELGVTKQTAGDPLVLPHAVSDTQWSGGKIVQATLQFTLVDDAEIWASTPVDTDGDGMMNHYDLNHDGDFDDANEDDPDDDNDGFGDLVEAYVGTDSLDACSDDTSDDAWPLDNNMDTFVTVVGDVLTYRGDVGKDVASYPDVQRLDLNMDGLITVVGDVLMYRGNVGSGCT